MLEEHSLFHLFPPLSQFLGQSWSSQVYGTYPLAITSIKNLSLINRQKDRSWFPEGETSSSFLIWRQIHQTHLKDVSTNGQILEKIKMLEKLDKKLGITIP